MNRNKQTTKGPKAAVVAQDASPVGFAITNHRTLIGLALVALILKSLIFAPIGWWPLTFVCLVPWLVMIGASTLAPRVYLYSYLFGLAFFVINMRWLYAATGLGYVALAIYLAAFFPFVACTVRHVVRRRGWPLAIAFPLIWTGCELIRAVGPTGFPWFFLSHGLHRVLTLIQISDVGGAYAVSFLAAACNGALADLALTYLDARRGSDDAARKRQARFGAKFALGLLLLIVAYGQVQLHRGTTSEGPRVAVLQGDYVSSTDPKDMKHTEPEKMAVYLAMMDAASVEKPDLFLIPESPWQMALNAERRGFGLSRKSFAELQARATHYNATIVTGSASIIETPYDLRQARKAYNSATIIHADGSEPDRYDKVHLVMFGEYIPFRFGRLRFVYLAINRLMPFEDDEGRVEYSGFPGTTFRVFSASAPSREGLTFRFGIPICYEDVMPYVSREFVGHGSPTKRADILLNISNDGWFGRGQQQPQHLAASVYRAVENRVGMARAVNTGVSGFITPTGALYDMVEPDAAGRWHGNIGYAVANVQIDSRYTIYTRYGDVLGWLCAMCWLILFIDYWVHRARGVPGRMGGA